MQSENFGLQSSLGAWRNLRRVPKHKIYIKFSFSREGKDFFTFGFGVGRIREYMKTKAENL
jgi:hypothetical protein